MDERVFLTAEVSPFLEDNAEVGGLQWKIGGGTKPNCDHTVAHTGTPTYDGKAIIAAAAAGTAAPADRVDFADKDDARRVCLGLLEHQARTNCLQVRTAGSKRGAMSRLLLLKLLHRFTYLLSAATCQSGYGAVCKTVYPGSIPGVASMPSRLW
jgi:hypothetical protein